MTHPTVRPTSADLNPSFVRTLIPLLVGYLGSWLTRQGLEINDDALAAGLTAVYSYVYYVVVRLLEVYGSPKWGYILGYAKSPAYETPTSDGDVPAGRVEP